MGEIVSKQRTHLGDVQLFAGVPVKIDDKEIDKLLELGGGHGFGLVKAGILLIRRGDPSAASTPEERSQIDRKVAADAEKSALMAKSRIAELERILEKERAEHGETRGELEKERAAHAETKGALDARRKLDEGVAPSEPAKSRAKG